MNIHITFRLIAIACLMTLLSACGGKEHRGFNFARIDAICDNNPRRAMAMLNQMPYDSLTEADRHHYDLLKIKAADKAFVMHTSDSLILDVIKYYSNRKDNPLYAEALYYGGRVYSDLKDLPKAIEYFQSTHIALEESENTDLKVRTLSQMSALLQSAKLYDESIVYAKEALRLDSLSGDPQYIMYDLERLGLVYLHSKKFDLAERSFRKAKQIAADLSLTDSISHNMYLAAIKYHTGKTDSALSLIRTVMHSNDSLTCNTALAYAAAIYKSASIPDTAYMYAHELINRKNHHNQKIGYLVLLSDELLDYFPKDSALQYTKQLAKKSVNYIRQNIDLSESINNMHFMHNMQKSETFGTKDKAYIYVSLALLSIVILILITYVAKKVWAKKSHKQVLENGSESVTIYEDNIVEQNDIIDEKDAEECNVLPTATADCKKASVTDTFEIVTDLRRNLIQEVLKLEQEKRQIIISPLILQSDVYRKITELINQKSSIADNSPIWKELEQTVLQVSPMFIHKLTLLSNGNLKNEEVRVALLTRIGVTSSITARLICLDKSTISVKKKTIMKKLFYDSEISHSKFNEVILLL